MSQGDVAVRSFVTRTKIFTLAPIGLLSIFRKKLHQHCIYQKQIGESGMSFFPDIFLVAWGEEGYFSLYSVVEHDPIKQFCQMDSGLGICFETAPPFAWLGALPFLVTSC